MSDPTTAKLLASEKLEPEVLVLSDQLENLGVEPWYKQLAAWIVLFVGILWFGGFAVASFLEIVPGWNLITDREDFFLAWAIGSAIGVALLVLSYVWYIWNAKDEVRDSRTGQTVTAWMVNDDHILTIIAYLFTVIIVYVVILILLWRFDDEYGNSDPYDVSANPRRFVDFIANMVVTFVLSSYLVYLASNVFYNHRYPMMQWYRPTEASVKSA